MFDLLYSSSVHTEFEAKFLHIDHDDIREKLRARGADCSVPLRVMRRAIIDYPDRRLQSGDPNAYVRIRDEGDRVTLTYKQFSSLTIDGAQEIVTDVSSFEDTIELFTSIGLEVASLQESKRETWMLGDCEIVLDEWPWLDPYIEIEASSESKIRSVASQLGLAWEAAVFGDVMVAYRDQYPHLTDEQTIGLLPEVLFGTPLPALFQERTNI